MSRDVSYPTYRNLPPLAGVCSMQRAVQAEWSLDESVDRLKRLHYVMRRLHEALTARITAEPIYELKTLFAHHGYLFAEHVEATRKRVSEMREPPLGLDRVPHAGLERAFDDWQSAPQTADLVAALYHHLLPRVHRAWQDLRDQAHPLADAPTVRTAKLIAFELEEIIRCGQRAADCLDDAEGANNAGDSKDADARDAWLQHLMDALAAAGQIDGREPSDQPVPDPWPGSEPYRYDPVPQRDERFRDPYNAGVNPEAFLYDPGFRPRDKTLMMYYKRIRELDVPEMMASILVEMRSEQPWAFHMEMSRQLWDEARHAMMGEVGFVSQGIDWTQIPINFTWSLNLNSQLDVWQRHGVLFFIEQGLMPRTGKRYEYEVAYESGDPLAALFQDFDWADEVLHAQIGRRWYVPRFKSLNEAMQYGDECWSKVLSHWQSYRDQGLTEHHNWWPALYTQACQNWGQAPDAAALAFDKTYENSRADLEELD
ncbi:hypothetical protein [Roseimaritima sediminicola]|uniref:hypothetical protein n=1 Tax=Roseimaritima sediminicola TaxID=2662066 RepID=UPI00129843E9|nr:hypothetical protein [Roseimaritima sediminicola]